MMDIEVAIKLLEQSEAIEELISPLRINELPVARDSVTIGIVAIEVTLSLAPTLVDVMERAGWNVVCSLSSGIVFRKAK